MVRIPPGVGVTDVQAALRQLDLELLRELFIEETVQLIAAAPTQPPATTLAAGGGGLGLRWADFSAPWAGANMLFATVSAGAQAQTVKNFNTQHSHVVYAQAMQMLQTMRSELLRVSRTVWGGRTTVVNTTPTTAELALPADAVAWCRVGMNMQVYSVIFEIVSLAPFVVQSASPHPLVAGVEYMYALPFRFRMPKFAIRNE